MNHAIEYTNYLINFLINIKPSLISIRKNYICCKLLQYNKNGAQKILSPCQRYKISIKYIWLKVSRASQRASHSIFILFHQLIISLKHYTIQYHSKIGKEKTHKYKHTNLKLFRAFNYHICNIFLYHIMVSDSDYFILSKKRKVKILFPNYWQYFTFQVTHTQRFIQPTLKKYKKNKFHIY